MPASNPVIRLPMGGKGAHPRPFPSPQPVLGGQQHLGPADDQPGGIELGGPGYAGHSQEHVDGGVFPIQSRAGHVKGLAALHPNQPGREAAPNVGQQGGKGQGRVAERVRCWPAGVEQEDRQDDPSPGSQKTNVLPPKSTNPYTNPRVSPRCASQPLPHISTLQRARSRRRSMRLQ